MKNASSYISKYLPKREDVMCTIISALGENKVLETPQRSSDIVCPMCQSSEFGATFMEAPGKWMWFCSRPDCLNYNISQHSKNQTFEKKEGMDWLIFCETFELGDFHQSVRFEEIDQPAKNLMLFRKFVSKPSNILIFSGDSDSGKTYAALGMAELFTRSSKSCCFYTFETLCRMWQEEKNFLFNRLTKTEFLILDDFGQRPPPDGFMTFIFDVINNRTSWSNKGTLITTNLSPDGIANYCGTALTNRFKAGTLLLFKSEGREKNRKSSWNVFK